MDTDGPQETLDHDPMYRKGELLRRMDNGELWHVMARLHDIDNDDWRYHLECDTHTRDDYLHELDMPDIYERTDVVVLHSHKPLQRLDGRLYDDG